MRSKAIFVALLALAFAAQGASVSQEEAILAARAWAEKGEALGACIGSGVYGATTHATTNGAPFYAVRMYGGGTVFMTSDTEMEPVIAFTDSGVDFSEIDRKSPLWALINRDVSERRAELDAKPVVLLKVAKAPAAESAAAAAVSDTEAKWAALIARGEELSQYKPLLMAASPRSAAPGDLRVKPLLKSTWDQSVAGGDDEIANPLACYNYYTPKDASGTIDEGNAGNAVCGCVATAMGQVMFYHRHPAAAAVPDAPGSCWFGATKLPGLVVSGEAYDWDAMVASPGEAEGEKARKAIGLLTSDAGRAVGMNYTDEESGALMVDAAKALGSVFGYGQSVYAGFKSMGSASASPTFGRVILSNIDAGYPVMLGISGAGGHAICADGYGYQGGVAYVHLNMGWSGRYNVWYNLPNIKAGGLAFNVVDDATYNIIPAGAGLGVMSGRVVDDEGAAIAAAEVSVYKAGTDSLVTQLVTSAYGVWGAALPAGTYDLAIVDAEKTRRDELLSVSLAAPKPVEDEVSWRNPDGTIGKAKYAMVQSKADMGNSWGNDVVLSYPSVRIVVGAETKTYTSLDGAIEGARAVAAAGKVPELEIMRPTELSADATIDFDCVLRAATGDETSKVVNRPNGAALTVASGASLVISNCDVQVTGKVPLIAEAGGKIFVGPSFSAERVASNDAFGFNVVGCVDADLAVECKVATIAGDVFGMATTDDPAALATSVVRLYATFDENREVRGSLVEVSAGKYRLVWATAPVPVESSVGYYVTAAGETNAFAKVDSLFASFENARLAGLLPSSPEIVVIGRDENGLSRNIDVDGFALKIRGEGGAFVSAAETSHITVTNGGSLDMEKVIVADHEGGAFIRIADGGAMTLGSGATITNLVHSAPPSTKDYSPIMVLSGGTLSLETGSKIVGCDAAGAGCRGGGVYVDGGGTIELAGGSIVGCKANMYGGGVYVANAEANVVVSGASVVRGNTDKNGTNDIHFAALGSKISVTRTAAGGSMGIKYSKGDGNAEGFAFATVAALASAHDREATAEAFFSDASSERVAEVDGTEIKWAAAATEDGGLSPIDQTDSAAMALAVAKVEYPAGFDAFPSPSYWESAQDAFMSLDGADGTATVTMLKDDWFNADVAVRCSVTLAAEGGARTLRRLGDASIGVASGASLIVSKNITFTDVVTAMPATVPYFVVSGGSLVLDGATITDITAYGRFASAVVVTDNGLLTVRGGAKIANYTNSYVYTSDRTGYAGAILANAATVVLEDCTIVDCTANRTGGVCVDNGGVVKVSGAATVSDNATPEGNYANLTVAASSEILLTGKLTGKIGVRRDVAADRVVFGRVDDAFSGSDADLVASAMNFVSDDFDSYGLAVRADDGATLLVWFSRLGDADTYTDANGVEYRLVSDASVPFPVDKPIGENFTYSGEEQTGVASGRGYALSGVAAATAAGSYTATARLKSGYVWSDDTTGDVKVTWKIAKAVYDLSGVTFEDQTFVYDGEPKEIAITGELPEGVTVEYVYPDGNFWTQPGEYTVIARFTGDDNYEPIPDMTATLTIEADEPQPPGPDDDPAQPVDVAFSAISQDGTTWALTVTTIVEKCWYSLFETNSLSGGFVIDEAEPVERRQATADDVPGMKFERPHNGAALFWRVVAEPEDAH